VKNNNKPAHLFWHCVFVAHKALVNRINFFSRIYLFKQTYKNTMQLSQNKCAGKKGFSIVELVIAVSIIAVFIVSITFSFSLFLRLAFSNTLKVKAAFLTEEALESVRFLKQSDWETHISSLESDTDYFLDFSANTWQISGNYTLIDGLFERRLVFEDVLRDNFDGRIVEEGGTLDEGTKKLTVFVSWQRNNATTTESFSTYIANI